MTKKYDLIVLGSGPGGNVTAIRASQLGFNFLCVEKRKSLGGTCLNIGCIPSKTLLYSSYLYDLSKKHFSHFGININGEVNKILIYPKKSKAINLAFDILSVIGINLSSLCIPIQ